MPPQLPSPSPLVTALYQEMQDTGSISFATYMERVLYHPAYGYYTARPRILGQSGDFVTSVHLSADFGELLAVQLAEMWQRLDCPDPFQLIELGPGQGLLAATILQTLAAQFPDCFAVTTYGLVERSPLLRATQSQVLQPWRDRVDWLTLDEMASGSVTGCFLSNEFFDALPVHVVEKRGGQLQEVYVAPADGSEPALPLFQERLQAVSTSRIVDYFDRLGLDLTADAYGEGYRTEVHLTAMDWMVAIATRLKQGYVLTIDYGYLAERYYNPRRQGGTLQCYTQQRHHNDPYWRPGEQDITAHVNFTALENAAIEAGLQAIGQTQQALFLMALGMGDRMAALSEATPRSLQQTLQRRAALRDLIDPSGLGNFIVAVQGTQSLAPYGLSGFVPLH